MCCWNNSKDSDTADLESHADFESDSADAESSSNYMMEYDLTFNTSSSSSTSQIGRPVPVHASCRPQSGINSGAGSSCIITHNTGVQPEMKMSSSVDRQSSGVNTMKSSHSSISCCSSASLIDSPQAVRDVSQKSSSNGGSKSDTSSVDDRVVLKSDVQPSNLFPFAMLLRIEETFRIFIIRILQSLKFSLTEFENAYLCQRMFGMLTHPDFL